MIYHSVEISFRIAWIYGRGIIYFEHESSSSGGNICCRKKVKLFKTIHRL